MKKYDVSALICTYNPDLDKLLMTVESFLLQEKIKIQIVITDDGSKESYFTMIEKIFKKNNFVDYKFVKNQKNIGTVLNICSGLEVCAGEYVKILSPGDYIYSKTTLHDWIAFMQLGDYAMTGSDYVCYRMNNKGEEYASIEKAHPQITNLTGKKLKHNYLINNDIYLGAAILVRKNILCKYMELLKGKVKYAEDNYLRIMIYCNEKVGFYPHATTIYEVGTGISTSGENEFLKLLQKDWKETDSIIESIKVDDLKFRDSFLKTINYYEACSKHMFTQKYLRYLRVRGLLLLKIRTKLKPRLTSRYIPEKWLRQLKEEYKCK